MNLWPDDEVEKREERVLELVYDILRHPDNPDKYCVRITETSQETLTVLDLWSLNHRKVQDKHCREGYLDYVEWACGCEPSELFTGIYDDPYWCDLKTCHELIKNFKDHRIGIHPSDCEIIERGRM